MSLYKVILYIMLYKIYEINILSLEKYFIRYKYYEMKSVVDDRG